MSKLADLRPHQAAALDELKWAIVNGKRRPLIEAATGYGKTVVAAHIVTGARAKGKRVVFSVPSLGLIDQTFARFVENGIQAVDMGVLQGDHPWRRPHAPIQIATAQTLARRNLPTADLVIIDEAHVRFSVYDRWTKDAKETLFIGLSATPWSRGLGKVFDYLIKTISVGELIEQQFLSPFRVFAPSHPDLTACRTVAGDWHEGDLGEIMGKPRLVADIVETWLVRGVGRPTLCFAVNRRHARQIHDQFAEVGVRVAYVDADTPREERERIGQQLASGEVQIAVNIGTLTTGIDWDVRCLILARPTRSEMLFTQIVGRGLRTAPGKQDCLILDHSDTHQRLGMVTDISHDELDDGKPRAKKDKADKAEKAQPLPKCCPCCTALMPATTRVCVSCGSELPMPDPVVEVDGSLIELGAGAKREKGVSIVDRLRAMGKQDVYGQLLHMQVMRGKKPGWVGHAYKDIFGTWPKGLSDGPDAHREPSSELLALIRAKAKAYAKQKEAEAKAAPVAPAAEVTNAAA